MTYRITKEFISKFKEYYDSHDIRPAWFAECTGSLAFLVLLEQENPIITRISEKCLERIVEVMVNAKDDIKSTEEYKELERLLEKDTYAESQNISEVQKINMTYALQPEFGDKLRKLRMSANFTSRELSKCMARSTGYISHLEKGVIQAINKSDLVYLTLILTGNLCGEELKDKEETINVETQEDVIKYLMSSMEENPNKLRNFFKDKGKENGAVTEPSDVLLGERESDLDVFYAQVFLNLKKLERGKSTESEKIAFMKNVNDFFIYCDIKLIEDIVKRDYRSIGEDTEKVDKLALKWKGICNKFNI